MEKISVIIPCRNEAKYIERCLNSIIKANYPQDLVEVFVIDGMSTDNSSQIIERYTKKYNNVFIVKNLKRSTPHGLNLGIKKSNSEIIVILGAHAEISTNFFSECINGLKSDVSIGCIGGPIENVYDDDKGKIISWAVSSPFGVGNAYFRTGSKSGFVDTVAFGAYKKEVFIKIGLFDEELIRNQDDEFNYRVKKAGYKIFLNEKIRVLYYVRSSFHKLSKQYFQYGYWKIYVNKKHKTVTTFRQIIPIFFVLFLLLWAITFFIDSIFLFFFTALFIFYLLLSVFYASAKTKNFLEIIKMMFVFSILHISYGLGYLFGILDFILLKREPGKRSRELTR